jgi:hypothetical protein
MCSATPIRNLKDEGTSWHAQSPAGRQTLRMVQEVAVASGAPPSPATINPHLPMISPFAYRTTERRIHYSAFNHNLRLALPSLTGSRRLDVLEALRRTR